MDDDVKLLIKFIKKKRKKYCCYGENNIVM